MSRYSAYCVAAALGSVFARCCIVIRRAAEACVPCAIPQVYTTLNRPLHILACVAYVWLLRVPQARGILSVDGTANEWTLVWKLLSNSVTLLVESNRTWQVWLCSIFVM